VPEDRLPDTSQTIHLEQIILREIRLPLKEPFRISSGTLDPRGQGRRVPKKSSSRSGRALT